MKKALGLFKKLSVYSLRLISRSVFNYTIQIRDDTTFDVYLLAITDRGEAHRCGSRIGCGINELGLEMPRLNGSRKMRDNMLNKTGYFSLLRSPSICHLSVKKYRPIGWCTISTRRTSGAHKCMHFTFQRRLRNTRMRMGKVR